MKTNVCILAELPDEPPVEDEIKYINDGTNDDKKDLLTTLATKTSTKYGSDEDEDDNQN